MEVAPGGLRYGVVIGIAGALTLLIHPAPAIALFALAGGAVWFHRDPDRSIPSAGIVAPADGTVKVVREEDGRLRVGTFMNVHDVHVNRAPVGGEVIDLTHEPGGHRPAFTKESEHNERVTIELDVAAHDDAGIDMLADGDSLTVTLIAGAFARRIHPYLETADSVDRGERIGHISFGSRVDVLFPPGVEKDDLSVDRGDSVTAGETVLVPGASNE